jgi:biotin carboxyl carrier protein
MKLFNEITADKAYRVLAILAKDGQQVTKDQALIAVEPV